MKNVCDVVIVGGGFAGLSLGYAISKYTDKVKIVERKSVYPDLFRAEKIEPDQAELMKKIGILNLRKPEKVPLGKVLNYKDNEITEFDTEEQYGISYCETVNNLREMDPVKNFLVDDAVSSVSHEGDVRCLKLASGNELKAKLVVIATGGVGKLTQTLDIKRRPLNALVSLNFGFDIKPVDKDRFDFNGFNYFLDESDTDVHYLTLFQIGGRYRVNIFSELKLKDSLTKEFKNDLHATLLKVFPKLEKYIGPFECCSALQVMPTAFYRLKNHIQPGVVVVGDEFQGVNPATGTGLSKVLTDVYVLSEKYVCDWLKKPLISAQDIKQYYRDKQKNKVDKKSFDAWVYYTHPKGLLSKIKKRQYAIYEKLAFDFGWL